MRLFDRLYKFVDDTTVWSAATFNAIWRSFDDRLHTIEEKNITAETIAGEIANDARDLVQATLDPALITIRKIQEQGFLVAASDTAVELVQGERYTFVIREGDSRNLFTPSTHGVLTRRSDPTNYAIVKLVSYSRATGDYVFDVLTSSFPPDAMISDWEVSATAGSTVAMLDYLATSQAVASTVLGARDAVSQDRTAIEQAKTAATSAVQATAADRLKTGQDRTAAQEARNQAEQFASQIDPNRSYTKTEADGRFPLETDVNTALASKADAAATTAALNDRDTKAEAAARVSGAIDAIGLGELATRDTIGADQLEASAFADEEAAQTGTSGDLIMSPQRVNQAIQSLVPPAKFESALLHVRDEKAAGTFGGAATAGVWNIRDLNTIKTNQIGASLASNKITLQAGTYFVRGSAPAGNVNVHRARLRSSGQILVEGSMEYAGTSTNVVSRSEINGRFTLSSSTEIWLEHYTQTTTNNRDFGNSTAAAGIAIYTDLLIWKVS